MGQGIEMARALAPEHAAAIDNMKDQLLIALIKRLGGTVEMPVSEVDDTGQDLLSFSLNPTTRKFTFVVSKKS